MDRAGRRHVHLWRRGRPWRRFWNSTNGGGGARSYANDISVTPGEVLDIDIDDAQPHVGVATEVIRLCGHDNTGAAATGTETVRRRAKYAGTGKANGCGGGGAGGYPATAALAATPPATAATGGGGGGGGRGNDSSAGGGGGGGVGAAGRQQQWLWDQSRAVAAEVATVPAEATEEWVLDGPPLAAAGNGGHGGGGGNWGWGGS